MPIIPLKCPSCSGNLLVNSDYTAAQCGHCGSQFIVKDAIVTNYINNTVNIKADTVNILPDKDFEIVGGVLKKYNGASTNILIPNNVSIIGYGAFKGCQGITSITIPNSVKKIDHFAFLGCQSLREIKLPESVEEIKEYAFVGAKNIKIVWPNSWNSRQLSKMKLIAHIDIPQGQSNAVLTLIYCGACEGSYHCTYEDISFTNDSYSFFDRSFLEQKDYSKEGSPGGILGMSHDVQKYYNELSSLLERAGINKDIIQPVLLPRFERVNTRKRWRIVPKDTIQTFQITINSN